MQHSIDLWFLSGEISEHRNFRYGTPSDFISVGVFSLTVFTWRVLYKTFDTVQIFMLELCKFQGPGNLVCKIEELRTSILQLLEL